MSESLTRLAWALPLVIVLGALAMLLMRRLLPHWQTPAAPVARLALHESLNVSETTRTHLLSVDGQRMLLVETRDQPSTAVLLPNAVPARLAAWPNGAWRRRT
jgi:hypothetical protein